MHVDDARKHAHREYQAGDDDRTTCETTARLEVLAHEPTDTPATVDEGYLALAAKLTAQVILAEISP